MIFFSSFSSGANAADTITLSESLVADVDRFVGVMDGLSHGRFLCDDIELLRSTVQWMELPWLKDIGYYSLEAFVANRLELALRLAWISSQVGKNPKEKKVREKAAKVARNVVNAFWRMKSCGDWWIGLVPGKRKVIVSAFFGKAANTLVEFLKVKNVIPVSGKEKLISFSTFLLVLESWRNLNKPLIRVLLKGHIDPLVETLGRISVHTCELHNVERKNNHQVSRIARSTILKSSVPLECFLAANDELSSVVCSGSIKSYAYKASNSSGGTSNEWPSITPVQLTSINALLLVATNILNLDVDYGCPYLPHSFLPSITRVGSSSGEFLHRQIFPSMAYPDVECGPITRSKDNNGPITRSQGKKRG